MAPAQADNTLLTPLTYGFKGFDDFAFCHEILDVSEAQTESVIQPNGVTDDLGRKPVSVVATHIGFHQRSLGGTELTSEPRT